MLHLWAPFYTYTISNREKIPRCLAQVDKNVNRKAAGGNWLPNHDSRICFVHFVGGEPTQLHPYTSLNLGYIPDNTLKPRSPPNEREPYVPAKKSKQEFLSSADTCSLDHVYSKPADSSPFELERDIQIDELQRLLKSVKLENMSLKIQINKTKTKALKVCVQFQMFLKATKRLSFIQVFQHFSPLLIFSKSCKTRLEIWNTGKGQKVVQLRYRRIVSKYRKLTMKEDLILTMMKLRLGLLFEDFADRFGISSSLASDIFTTWVKVLS